MRCDHSLARKTSRGETKFLGWNTGKGFEQARFNALPLSRFCLPGIRSKNCVDLFGRGRGLRHVQVGDQAPLEAASEMLGCNKHHLRNALLTRSLAAGGEGGATFMSNGGSRRTRGGVETLTVPLSKAQACRARDKLGQEVSTCALRVSVCARAPCAIGKVVVLVALTGDRTISTPHANGGRLAIIYYCAQRRALGVGKTRSAPRVQGQRQPCRLSMLLLWRHATTEERAAQQPYASTRISILTL